MGKGFPTIALSVFLCLTSAAAQADANFDIKVNRTWVSSGGRATALVTVTNNTMQSFQVVIVKCVFLLNNEPVFIGENYSSNLGPHDSDTIEVSSETSVQMQFNSTRCRVSQTAQ